MLCVGRIFDDAVDGVIVDVGFDVYVGVDDVELDGWWCQCF